MQKHVHAPACMNEHPLNQREAFFEDLFWLRCSKNGFELTSDNIARALKECSTLSKCFFAFVEEERAQAARAAAAPPTPTSPTPTRETGNPGYKRKPKRNSEGDWSP